MNKLNFSVEQIKTLKGDNENPTIGGVTSNLQLHLAMDWLEMKNEIDLLNEQIRGLNHIAAAYNKEHYSKKQ